MIRTTSLVVAGALLTATGCQHAVYGDRAYRSGNVYGDGAPFSRPAVYGDATFHERDRVDGSPEFARRPSAADTALPASARTDTPSRHEPAPIHPPGDAPVDEVARSSTPPSDKDRPVVSTERPHVTSNERAPVVDVRPSAGNDNPDRAGDTTPKSSPATPGGRDPEMVARANTARYPDDLKPSDDLRASAVFDRANKTLRIDNNSGHDILGGNLWASETYVTPVPNIPAGGSTSVQTSQFFDRDGKGLPSFNDVVKLQLQSGGKLYNLKLEGGVELNK
jgi:hypothetical protein